MSYLKDKYDQIFLTIGILILSIVIFFPLSSDLAAFIQGGIALKDGGHLYVNFFDVKPPFVNYLFEFIYTLFGKNITIYRVFDVAYMTTFLLSSLYVFNRLGFNKNAIRFFTVLMPIVYTSLDFPSANQVETLLFLPLIWYYYLSSNPKKNKLDILINGVLLVFAINLKYTFSFILVADILYLLIQKKNIHYIITQSSIQIIIALILSYLLLLPFIFSGNFDAFINFVEYMKEYNNYPPLESNFIFHIIKVIYSFFADNNLLILLLTAIYTIYIVAKKEKKNETTVQIKGLIIFLVVLFCSVFIERIMFPYHKQRFFPFLVMFLSLGIILLISEVKKYKKLSIAMILFVYNLFNPIYRFIKIIKYPTSVISKAKEEFYCNLPEENEGHSINKQYEQANYINKNACTDKVLMISTALLKFYYILILIISIHFHNLLYILTIKPLSILREEQWKI